MKKYCNVFEYNLNCLCVSISNCTNTSLSYVKNKQQIKYLDTYLSKLMTGSEASLTFIHEKEYIDKYYVDDYAEYYVRCFKIYSKTCFRMHFFKHPKQDNLYQALEDALSNKKSIFNNENYLGYIVIRPIPQTFLANTCLKRVFDKKQNNRQQHFIISKEYNLSLFGINLTIDSVAQQEQDNIVSACATSSLWSFMHAHPSLSLKHLPSPSLITKRAYGGNENQMIFPNKGLSKEMIRCSLKANGLTSELIEISSLQQMAIPTIKIVTIIKDIIFSYVSSGIPLILGVSVRNGEDTLTLGRHAITVLGYNLNSTSNDSKVLTKGENIRSIYIHDDRIGCFLEMDFCPCEFKIKPVEQISTNTIISENYHIETLIIGVYHKIRIPYEIIRNTCEYLTMELLTYLNRKSPFKTIVENIVWDIRIREVSELKHWILKKSNISDKTKYLVQSWPKYIWYAEAKINDDDNDQEISLVALLFDATDIKQGHVFFDLLRLNDNRILTSAIILLMEMLSEKLFYVEDSMERDFLGLDMHYIPAINAYFKKQSTYLDSLDELFGEIKVPNRINPGEMRGGNIIVKVKYRLDRIDEKITLDQLSQNENYIWVIDLDGFLCIGIETNDIKKKAGHPTITDGKPARIGGELKKYDKEKWIVNYYSGRYSKDYIENEKIQYLENAIRYKFKVFFPNEVFEAQINEI